MEHPKPLPQFLGPVSLVILGLFYALQGTDLDREQDQGVQAVQGQGGQ